MAGTTSKQTPDGRARANEHEALFDAAAESLILVDPEDAESVAELAERVMAIADWFAASDGAGDAGPARLAADAARRLEGGDASALVEIEAAFGSARAEADRRAQAIASKAQADACAPVAASAAAAAPMPLAGDEELLRDFAVRAAEHLDDADEHLLALEADPSSSAAVDAVFRAFHTIKGMAGFLALDAISEHAHGSESLLAEVRSTGGTLEAHAVQALFVAVDTMRVLCAQAGGLTIETTAGDEAPREAASAGRSGGREPEAPCTAAVAVPGCASGVASAVATAPASEPGAAGSQSGASVRTGSVRVEEGRLDALLDAIGEMVIAESMVSASMRTGADASALESQVDRLDKITRELQQMATSLRMVPVRATFRRMARLVRDVATKAGKDVEFVVTGEDTELDKIVVDRISDPLIHALRNAVDHGIESGAERTAAGKPAGGRIELSAYHAGGAIHIEVTDDGRGLDAEKILARARERGIIGEDDRPDERAILELIFAPGFSTADRVTDVSGRGVGMDVVRRAVEELRGRVDVRSRAGEGTTIAIRLPLTLAIIDGMTLRVADERYVLPLLSIQRSVRPTAEQVATIAGRGEMLSLDGELVPIIRLHRLFSTSGAETDLTNAVVVIIDDNGAHAGLVACELLGQQQTVIKPLGEGLPEQPGVAGGAIMADGRVGLILDAAGLIRHAQRDRSAN